MMRKEASKREGSLNGKKLWLIAFFLMYMLLLYAYWTPVPCRMLAETRCEDRHTVGVRKVSEFLFGILSCSSVDCQAPFTGCNCADTECGEGALNEKDSVFTCQCAPGFFGADCSIETSGGSGGSCSGQREPRGARAA